ncbi:MAG TPA: ATP-binding protein [Holophaga sp.]|nr:ATP-binding protein [Holophaga sp.]
MHRSQPSPAGAPALARFRERLVDVILKAGAVLGAVAYVPSLVLALEHRFWTVAVVDTLVLGWIALAALSPHWSYRVRSLGLLAAAYGLSLGLLLKLGAFASGPLWLGTVPVLAALLWNLRAAFLAWLLAGATYAACGIAAVTGHLPAPPPQPPGAAWVVIAFNGLLLSALISISASYLIRGLLRQEERFSRVFHASPEPIAFSRLRDDRFLDLNPAWTRVYGWSREEALGRTPEELGIWGESPDRAALRREMEATGGVAPRRVDLVAKGGVPVHVLLTARVADLDGEPCLLVLSQDLTASIEAERDRERLEAELLHAQKLESLGLLAGGVAHDMNNVLAAIVSVASTLREARSADPALARPLDTVLEAAERGRRLVRTLNAFGRKGLEAPRPVDLNALVRSQAEILRGTTFSRVEVVEDLDPDLGHVTGEAASLGAALMNLCVNALDAMPAGGTLTLATRGLPGGGAELTVADTGQGMSPEVLRRAMEPFFTTKPAGKGTGLGLAGVYGTLKAHGGAVEIRSREGEGTRVALTFPAGGPGTVPDEAPAAQDGTPAGLRILLVDDDPIILDTVPPMLAQLGHGCSAASGGREALALVDGGYAPDLVLLDNNMPGMSGVETLAALRERRPHLPVVVATGYVEEALVAAVQGDPLAWILEKPFTLADLRARIAEVCAGLPA